MKKSLLFGLLAALTAVVIFTGCPTDPDIEYRDKIVEKEKIVEKDKIIDNDVMIHIDTLAENQAGLVAALANPAYEDKVIGYDGSTALASESVTIGEKYAVYILNGGDLATGSGAGLTVEGTLWVGYGAALTVAASSEPVVVDGGVVHVVTGGTLSIDSEESILLDVGGDTALGTDAVSIVNGTLEYTEDDDFVDAADITKALGYITKGLLNIGEVEVALKPSVVAGISIPQDKNLNANTGSEAETGATLIIPEGLDLTTSATLDTVTSLTVNGTLTASNATLKSDGAALTVGANGLASIGAAKLLTSTVTGSLTLNGDLTLDEEAVLTIVNPGLVSGSASEVIKAEGASITIAGYEGFTTTSDGVAANGLAPAALALQADWDALTGDKTAEATDNSTAVDVEDDGTIEFSSGTTVVEDEVANVATASSDVTIDDPEEITLSFDTILKLTDTGYAGDGPVVSVITFGNFRLANNGLISPVTPITVTLTTQRSS